MQNRGEPDSTWSDSELVRAYQVGIKAAWDILYLRHGSRLRGFFYIKGIRNPEDLDDLVHETFFEAMVQIDDLRNPEGFPRWLVRVAVGTMARQLEKSDERREFQEAFGNINNLVESGELCVSLSLRPERIAIDKEYMEIVFSLMEQLPPSEKEAFWLYLDGMKNTEIAEMLGIKAGAVNVRIYKARKKLKAWLETEYPEVHADLVNRGII